MPDSEEPVPHISFKVPLVLDAPDIAAVRFWLKTPLDKSSAELLASVKRNVAAASGAIGSSMNSAVKSIWSFKGTGGEAS